MRVMRLLQMGLPADRAQHFADYLKQLGEGNIQVHPDIGEDMIRVLCPTENVDDLITLMYGGLNDITDPTQRTDFIVNRAILTPKNKDVDVINSKVTAIFNDTDGNAVEHSYCSADSVADTDHAHLYPVEFLNSLELSGVPPHELKLKIGSPIMLLRNLTGGLANGTRLICKAFMPHVIEAVVATGPTTGSRVFLPRVGITPSNADHLPFKLRRRQFPIKPAFAMTINKSQGQTFQKVGIYLPEPVFSHHGQLYVAESRVGDEQGVKIMVVGHRHLGPDGFVHAYTKNVVYKEVLH
jgi:ATP-dependent DNA helicase PIF1